MGKNKSKKGAVDAKAAVSASLFLFFFLIVDSVLPDRPGR
jgi:hypothetical protein